MIKWEGAEVCYYHNGESNSFSLSDTQFAIIVKILGIELTTNGINCFSDETLKKFTTMDSNPLKFVKINKKVN